MSQSNLLWRREGNTVWPPQVTPNLTIPGNVYVGGDLLMGRGPGSMATSIQSQLDALNAQLTDLESGSDLTGRLANLNTNVIVPLSGFTELYRLGHFDLLEETFGYNEYRDIVCSLAGESYPENEPYTALHTYVAESIEGLYKSVLMNISSRTQIVNLNNIIQSLQAQIDGNAPPIIMDITASLNTVALIRPEIQTYINLYGFPPGGVFDAQLLYDILAELGADCSNPYNP